MADVPEKKMTIRVGSRKSELAMIQTNAVIDRLKFAHPNVECEIVTMETIGDMIQNKPLSAIGQSNLFTKELEKALDAGHIDMIVHSMKDLPSLVADKMALIAVCQRESPYDVLVLHSKHKGKTLETLPKGSVIGTSSVRRVACTKRLFPHLLFKDVRGNLNTRLRKLDEDGVYDGIIIAEAGIRRMGWDDRISQVLADEKYMYAASQGILCVELLKSNTDLIEKFAPLLHPPTVLRCVCERSLLKTLEGGCSAPVAVRTSILEGQITLQASALSLDGSEYVSVKQTESLPETLISEETTGPHGAFCSVIGPGMVVKAMRTADDLGIIVAKQLKAEGADLILQKAKFEIADKRTGIDTTAMCEASVKT